MDLAACKTALQEYDALREEVIIQSRTVLRLAKQLIYALHRGEKPMYDELVSQYQELQQVGRGTQHYDGLQREGSKSDATQEYVEACAYHDFVYQKEIRSAQELDVSTEDYLLGICDLSGELVRRTVNAVIRDDITEAERSAEFVQQLYGQMLEFDLRNGLLRKKVDGMKYAVQKVQDVLYDVHLRRDMDG